MASLGSLLMTVGADLSPFNAAMGDLNGKLLQAERDAGKAWSGFEAMGSRMTAVGASLSAAVTAPLIGIGAVSAKAFGDFEAALNRVSALGEITGKDLDTLKAQALDLGAKTQFSAKQAADGMAELAAAGFKTTDVMKAMPGVLDLAASGQMEVGRAAEVAANVMGGFGIKAEGIGHAVDVMAKAAASGSLGVNDLAFTFKYVGPVAKAAGLSLEEVAAATTLLSNAGIKGEQAGTTLRGALAKLLDPSKEAATTLDRLGVVATDSSGKLLPFGSIIDQLGKSGATTRDIFSIFGQETASGMQALVSAGAPALQKMTAELQNSDGAARKMADTLQGGMGGALERAKGSIETAGIALGQSLAPVIIQVAGLVESGANKVAEFAGWFAKLPEPVQTGAIAFTALVAALGPMLLIGGQVAGAIVSIQGAIAVATPLLGTLTGGFVTGAAAFAPWIVAIGAATAALVALGVWVNDNWDSIKASVGQAWEGIAEMWSAAWEPIKGVLLNVWGAISTAAEVAFRPVVLFYSTVWDGIGPYFRSAWDGITSILTSVWNGIKATAQSVWGGIVSVFQTFLEWAAKIPGAAKLMNLDEAWAGAKKTHAELAKVTDASKDLTKEATKAAASHVTLGKGLDSATAASKKAGKAHKETSEHSEILHRKSGLLYEISKQLAAEHEKHVKSLAGLVAKYGDVSKIVPQVIVPTEELNRAVQDLVSSVHTTGPAWIKALDTTQAELEAALAPVRNLEAAYKTLGINSAQSAKDHAAAAQQAYSTIRDSGTATANEVAEAWRKSEVARIEAAKAAGEMIPAEAEKALARLKTSTEKGTADATTVWKGWGAEVGSIITGLSANLTRSLWESPGSFFEKGEAALKGLGTSFVSHLVAPFGKETQSLLTGAFADLIGAKGLDGVKDAAIKTGLGLLDHFTKPLQQSFNDLISGVFSDLIGGKGFGGLADSAKNAGKAIIDVFGASTSIPGGGPGSPPPINSSPAPGSSPASQGVAGAVSAAAAVVSAISDVISNFQLARQENTLNAIEESTRYTKGYLRDNIVPMAQKYWPDIHYILGGLYEYIGFFGTLQTTQEFALDALRDISIRTEQAVRRFDQIGNDVMYGSESDRAQEILLSEIRDRADSSGRSMVSLLTDIRELLRTQKSTSLTTGDRMALVGVKF